jgi:hypothetical protein
MSAGVGKGLGDQRVDHRPNRFGIAVRCRQLGVMHQRALDVDEPRGDLRAADVECKRDVHQCLWVLSG